MDYLAVLAIGGSQDLAERPTLREFHHRMIKFPPNHEINVLTSSKTLGRMDLDRGSHETDFQPRLGFLHQARQAEIARKSHGRSKEDHKLVIARDPRRLLGRDFVRGSVEQAAPG